MNVMCCLRAQHKSVWHREQNHVVPPSLEKQHYFLEDWRKELNEHTSVSFEGFSFGKYSAHMCWCLLANLMPSPTVERIRTLPCWWRWSGGVERFSIKCQKIIIIWSPIGKQISSWSFKGQAYKLTPLGDKHIMDDVDIIQQY